MVAFSVLSRSVQQAALAVTADRLLAAIRQSALLPVRLFCLFMAGVGCNVKLLTREVSKLAGMTFLLVEARVQAQASWGNRLRRRQQRANARGLAASGDHTSRTYVV